MGGESKQIPYYRQATTDVLNQLDSDLKIGLTDQEATKRLGQYGQNKLIELTHESGLHKYLRQYKDMMIILLLVSAVISALLGDVRTAAILVALVLFNTVIGFSQEFKAEKLMESLENLVVSEAKAIRDAKLVTLSSSELVPGDIVYIEEGDSVPADLRLLSESELSSNDFALTGESNPSRKFTHAISGSVELANRHNLTFMSTTVATGHGYGVVIATGMQTELGRIASLSADTPADLSPLQRELNHIAARVTQGTIVLCSILLPIAIYSGLPFRDALLFAIGIASSLIPQGLPAEINTTLAQAAKKLVKAKALVKKLSAVETLGSTSVICTDKTGTLTKNQMTVERLLIGHSTYSVNGTGYDPTGHILDRHGKALTNIALKQFDIFFACGSFASNAHVNPPDDDHNSWYTVGDPTEGALVTLALKSGLNTADLDTAHPELKEFTFDSARKRMSSVRIYGHDKQLYVFLKGAPESILHRCNDIWDGGHVRKMTQKDRDMIDRQNHDWASQASRNIGYAFQILPKKTNVKKLKMETVETNLTWLGMVGMVDPLREEVPAAMAAAHKAHIAVSIITGDFAVTAQAIAQKAGLAKKGQEIIVISGEEMRNLDDARVLFLASRGGVIFSRVSPEDKLRIVSLVKSKHVVAVTGDGINDAPALKRADIGVAMGKTGTDVAKQSAEIVLLDDSFHTLIGAVGEGRLIFENIKKATLSYFTGNAAELVVNLLSLGAAVVFKVPLALTVLQILAIDLIAEVFPIAALGWDKADRDMMAEKPRDPNHHILNWHAIPDILWAGFIIGGLAFLNFVLYFGRHAADAQGYPAHTPLHMHATALTYLTIVLCQLLNILQRRSSKGLFTRYQLHNKQLFVALLVSALCIGNIIYNPLLNTYFGAAPLSLVDWLYALGAAAIFVLIREVQRYANTHHSRDVLVDLYRQTFSSD